MKDWLAERALASPRATAVITRDESWDYGQLDALAGSIGANLAGLVDAGDRLAVLMPNDVTYVALIHALARIGVALVPLNIRLTAEELAWQLRHAECRGLVYGTETTDMAQALAPYVDHIIDRDALRRDPGAGRFAAIQPFALERIQAIVFTSGTTGRPKGAMLSFSNHFWSAAASAFRLGLDPGDRWLSCLPLYHVGGLAVIFRSCLYGTAVVLHEGFEAGAVSQALDNQGITLISLVPTMVYRLLAHRRGRPWPATLRALLLGGAAASEDLLAICTALQIPVSPTYGLTEAASQVATMRPEESRRKPGSAGKPLMFTRVEILDEKGRPAAPGETGEIVVSGPTVMAGYYNDPAATAEILRDGRLHTGDMGYLDEEGDLWLVQRRSDIIISGGENIYPAEIEAVLQKHPQVAAACVVPVADEEWGQRAAAMVVLNKAASIRPADLEAYCRRHIAGYKIPRFWLFASDLPLTASGKVHRQQVAVLMAEAASAPLIDQEGFHG